MPHRAPGSPGRSRQQLLSGKPIRYYRPQGSPEIRHLIDQMTEEERRDCLVESLFLNAVKYENDRAEAYMRKLSNKK